MINSGKEWNWMDSPKKKIIAMIPVRLGSKRVPNKNLRLLGNKPLVAYIIEAAKEANVFDEIFINSESDIFKEIADEYGVKFYKRPEHLSTDEATNDDFTLDIMQPQHTHIQQHHHQPTHFFQQTTQPTTTI